MVINELVTIVCMKYIKRISKRKSCWYESFAIDTNEMSCPKKSIKVNNSWFGAAIWVKIRFDHPHTSHFICLITNMGKPVHEGTWIHNILISEREEKMHMSDI